MEIHAHFRDRKGFTKELILSGDTPPKFYRFAVLPRIDITILKQNDLRPDHCIETVEFRLSDYGQKSNHTLEAFYEEA